MEIFHTDIFLSAIAMLLLLLSLLWLYFKWCFTYWKKRNVPYLQPQIPSGTYRNLFRNRLAFGEMTSLQYRQAKQNGYKFVGLYVFTDPILMPLDPLLIKDILTTNFKSFTDHGIYFNEKDDPLTAHLFSLEGHRWKSLRAKLTPTFSSGKLKIMVDIIVDCGDQLKAAMDIICSKDEPVDIKDVLARFTINVIGSIAFGIECNTFVDENSSFIKYGKKIFNYSKLHDIRNWFAFANRDLARRLKIRLHDKEACDFFMQVVKNTIEDRTKNKIQRNDFIQLLINLYNGTRTHYLNENDGKYVTEDGNLTFEEIAAQAFVFIVAGYESSSTIMTFCLFELALNSVIQEKARSEIHEVLLQHGGKITYECIGEMKYLEQVISETLRKYPPLPLLNRKCTETYTIPNTNVVIDKGTSVFIPVMGLQNDEEYFRDPECFDPERFNDTNRSKNTPYTYFPFGEGPRTCIAMRFGLLQTKIGLTLLLRNFKFSLNPKTKTPIKMDPSTFVLSTLGDMWLNVEKAF